MSIFNDYALYYNALYADKDYAGEVRFILDCLQKNNVKPQNLLDLGCGTARHALEMGKLDIQVHGIDMSSDMIEMGKELLSKVDTIKTPTIEVGDARTFRDKADQKFDVVTSLFHVMSYQNTEEDALAVFETAKFHLKENGYFLFDFWYGPCVLKERPEYREKTFTQGKSEILRIAEPELFINENRVEVNYTMLLNKGTHEERSFQEKHSMRYWFLPELEFLARTKGFTVCDKGAWMNYTHSSPTENDWGVWMLIKNEN